VLRALLAAGLLQPWLVRAIERALIALAVGGGSEPDLASLDALLSEQQRQLEGGGVVQIEALRDWKRQRFEEQAYQRFLERGSKLDQFWLSLLQTNDPHLAQEWFFQLREGEAGFGDLAPASLGAERASAGRLGPLRLTELQPPLDRLLQRCLPGEVQPPLALPSGRLVVLRLDERLPVRWDDSLRDALVDELYRAWLGRALEQLRQQELRPDAFCSILLP